MKMLKIEHPAGDMLQKDLQAMLDLSNIEISFAPEKRLVATIETPTGVRMLS